MSGHFLTEENPDVTAKLLREFFLAGEPRHARSDERSVLRLWIASLRSHAWGNYRRSLKNSRSSVAASLSPTPE